MASRAVQFIWICGLYALLVLVLSVGLLSNLVFDDLLAPLREAVAGSAAVTLGWVGLPVTSSGVVIRSPGRSLVIVNECTGVDATILLVAAVLVFPAGWRAKLGGLGLAVGVMMAVNFTRVLTLVGLGVYRPDWIETAHLYVWPVGVILCGVGTLLFWAERFASPRGG